jgi:hypothetical protein
MQCVAVSLSLPTPVVVAEIGQPAIIELCSFALNILAPFSKVRALLAC